MQGTKNISCFCSKWLMKWISCDHIEHLTYESHRSGCHSCRRFPSSSISIADMSLMLRVRNEKLQDIPKLQPSLLIEIWRTMQTIEAFDFYFLRIFLLTVKKSCYHHSYVFLLVMGILESRFVAWWECTSSECMICCWWKRWKTF